MGALRVRHLVCPARSGLLVLQRLYSLSLDRRFTWFVWTWKVRLVLTAGGLTTKGTRSHRLPDGRESRPGWGLGMGHILLSVGSLLLFLMLGRRIHDTRDDGRVGSVHRTPAPRVRTV